MAETIWSLARHHLCPYLIEVANMIKGVPKDVEDMKKELEKIQDIIHNADRVAAAGENTTQEEIKAKVKLLIEAYFRMEDVIDEYMIHEEQDQPHDPVCAALPCEPADYFIKTIILRLQIAYKIQGVKSRVRAFNKSSESKSDFHIQPFLEQVPSSSTGNQNMHWKNLREAPLYMEEDEIVGFEAPKDELIGWLVKGREERTVICVVGMGGLGKTTLAKKVFDNKEVIGHFDCHAWTTVSQSYTVDGVLRDMLQKFYKQRNTNLPEEISKMDRKALIDEVRTFLQQKRYVVIFDDVWDEQFWNDIECAVINKKTKSRIIITTRHMKVAESCKKSSFVKIHELKPLSPEKSWQLFCKKAFQFEFNGNCPAELEHISSQIVEKCNGLPLALVVIAGLFSSKGKTSVDEWEEFGKNLNLELQRDKQLGSITKILMFSYNDFEIKSKRLIRQWIAEGFVKYKEGKTLEKVAEGYLKELTDRSLVQASSLTIDGKVRSCRVHDLTREMILRKCEDLRFCHHVRDKSTLSGITRRLSVAASFNDLMSISESSIRSVFAFTYLVSEQHVRRIPTLYMLLKVLDFEYVGLSYIPENLGNLIHLKYLSIGPKLIRSIPKSIAMLQNLETLILRGAFKVEMPQEISKLRKLRHFQALYMSLSQLKHSIGGMTSLQTLTVVKINKDGVELIRELGRLTQMRKLSLVGVRDYQETTLCSSISKMQYLESLRVGLKYGDDTLNWQFNSPLPMLRKLSLLSLSERLPEWIAKHQKLVKLTLKCPLSTEDPMKSLKDMPYLLYLELDFYKGVSLHFEDGGFKELKELMLSNMDNLNSICIDKVALRSLKSLTLSSIPKLEVVPSGIQHLNELEVFKVTGMSEEFKQTLLQLKDQGTLPSRSFPVDESDLSLKKLDEYQCFNFKDFKLKRLKQKPKDLKASRMKDIAFKKQQLKKIYAMPI
ncbi:disease resistance protein RPM1-like [Abrus precatorius]|uniref:Disease resistance protein RPM1-like n=1 Tax=Abrus precatorius TaxID=3816 RepID=A0A8B8KB97_ABRPR|nr:disease resistance protein RPM1-like [Abrus precatorius]